MKPLIEQVAKEMNLDEDWLNDDVKVWVAARCHAAIRDLTGFRFSITLSLATEKMDSEECHVLRDTTYENSRLYFGALDKVMLAGSPAAANRRSGNSVWMLHRDEIVSRFGHVEFQQSPGRIKRVQPIRTQRQARLRQLWCNVLRRPGRYP